MYRDSFQMPFINVLITMPSMLFSHLERGICFPHMKVSNSILMLILEKLLACICKNKLLRLLSKSLELRLKEGAVR